MDLTVQLIMQNAIRFIQAPFKARDFAKIVSDFGVRCTIKMATEYLNSCIYVFRLSDELYISRCGMFSDRWFSFKPSKYEIEAGVFVAGDRCLPFVDSEILSTEFTFIYKDKELEKKANTFPSDLVSELFMLYGEEFAPQYIMADPVNEGKLDLSIYDYNIPYSVKLTGFSLKPLIDDGLKYGDRILCKVTDWNDCIIEIQIDKQNENPFEVTLKDEKRENWYKKTENSILEYLEIIGPRNSLEEQIAYLYFNIIDDISIKECGSLTELLQKTKKIGIELFGVESRLWKKGECVPAFGLWNKNAGLKKYRIQGFGQKYDIEPLPNYIRDSFLKDLIYKDKEEFEAVFDCMYPLRYLYEENQVNSMLLHLKSRHDILKKQYNKFNEFEIAESRHQILKLFSYINILVCKVDSEGRDFSKYPQQPLVTLSQLFSHVNLLLDVIENDPSQFLKEKDDIMSSLDGMQYNYECVLEELSCAIENEKKNGFTVV